MERLSARKRASGVNEYNGNPNKNVTKKTPNESAPYFKKFIPE